MSDSKANKSLCLFVTKLYCVLLFCSLLRLFCSDGGITISVFKFDRHCNLLCYQIFPVSLNLFWHKTGVSNLAKVSTCTCIWIIKRKGRNLTQSPDKRPYTNKNIKKAKWQHKQLHIKFDYTAVADRLRTVSWSDYGHPTGVVYLVYGPVLPTPRNSNVIKRTHVLKKCK